MRAGTETRRFEPSGGIPNSRLPAVILRDALPREARDGRAACALLYGNGWGGNWLYGVYPFWHFHTKGHEALACVGGRARLGLGGEHGIEVEVRQGRRHRQPVAVCGVKRQAGGGADAAPPATAWRRTCLQKARTGRDARPPVNPTRQGSAARG